MVRIKNRYLLVNILYPSSLPSTTTTQPVSSTLLTLYAPTTDLLTHKSLLTAIRSKIQELFGDYGTGCTSSTLQIKYLSCATSTIIFKIARKFYRLLWAALSFMHKVPLETKGEGMDCVFQVVKVSGTIRKVEEEAIKRARDVVERARKEAGEVSEKLLVSMYEGAADVGQMEVDIGGSDGEMEDDDNDAAED